MLDLLFSGTMGESLTLINTLTILGASLFLGLFISIVYIKTKKTEGFSTGFAITLIMLPAIIAMIILLVGNNVARAFSLAGAFSLIRFRSAPGDPKDISYVFFTVAVGLSCGMGYVGYAALFAVILCAVMALLTLSGFATKKTPLMQLKILVPENIDYNGLFDNIFNKYTQKHNMTKIKTADYGTLFELTYEVSLKDLSKSKEFIDNIRCKNGNLNVVLSLCAGTEIFM